MDETERAQWLADRCGKLTASRMADAMDYRKDGKEGAKRQALRYELCAERMTDRTTRHYVTPEMQHGLDYEEEAKAAYEALTGRIVEPMGFIVHPDLENFGATPDGIIATESGVLLCEVKCPTTHKFLAWSQGKEAPEEYRPQMIAQCLCTGARAVAFVAYDPRIKDVRRRILVRQYEPSDAERAAVHAEAVRFLAELDALFDAFNDRTDEWQTSTTAAV